MAKKPHISEDNTPPVLGSWRNVYIFVLGFQAVVIILFALMMYYYKV